MKNKNNEIKLSFKLIIKNSSFFLFFLEMLEMFFDYQLKKNFEQKKREKEKKEEKNNEAQAVSIIKYSIIFNKYIVLNKERKTNWCFKY